MFVVPIGFSIVPSSTRVGPPDWSWRVGPLEWSVRSGTGDGSFRRTIANFAWAFEAEFVSSVTFGFFVRLMTSMLSTTRSRAEWLMIVTDFQLSRKLKVPQ